VSNWMTNSLCCRGRSWTNRRAARRECKSPVSGGGLGSGAQVHQSVLQPVGSHGHVLGAASAARRERELELVARPYGKKIDGNQFLLPFHWRRMALIVLGMMAVQNIHDEPGPLDWPGVMKHDGARRAGFVTGAGESEYPFDGGLGGSRIGLLRTPDCLCPGAGQSFEPGPGK